MWQRIWVGAGELRGQGARTPEMEWVAKSSCTQLRTEECLFRRQAVELVTERGRLQQNRAAPSPLFSLCILRVFVLGRRRDLHAGGRELTTCN